MLKIAVEAGGMTRPVREFMQRSRREFFRAIESEVWRKLDVVG
jgi:hypothetical protein